MLAKAIQIASEAHLNQIDKGGKPYILHPLWVMDKVRHLGEDYMVVAVLHDVIEDTNWTLDNLRIVLSACDNYTDNIITALSLLTKVLEDQDYMNYIRNISFNPIAEGRLKRGYFFSQIPIDECDSKVFVEIAKTVANEVCSSMIVKKEQM